MKIIITESQLQKLILESEECPCGDGTTSVDCCSTDSYDSYSHVSDSIGVINYALDKGLDLKKHASEPIYRRKWNQVTDNEETLKILPKEYQNYIPEIVSGVKPGFTFDKRLIDILSEIESISGLELEITGGRDYFHLPKNPNSKHNIGKAVDFVPKAGMNDKNDSKVESAVFDIIISGKYGNGIGLINERLYPSGHASGPHFHLSLDSSSVEYSKFAYIDKIGNKYTKPVPKWNNLMWGDGKFPKNLSKMIEDKILQPFRVKMSNKEFCDKLIELENNSPDYVDGLPKDIYDGDVRKKLRDCKTPPAGRLPINNVTKIDNNVNIPNEIVRDEYMYELFKDYDLENMSKRELKKLVRKVKEDGKEDLVSTIKYHIPTPLKDLYDIYIRK